MARYDQVVGPSAEINPFGNGLFQIVPGITLTAQYADGYLYASVTSYINGKILVLPAGAVFLNGVQTSLLWQATISAGFDETMGLAGLIKVARGQHTIDFRINAPAGGLIIRVRGTVFAVLQLPEWTVNPIDRVL